MLTNIDSSNWQVGTTPVNGFGGDVLSISLPTAFSTSGKKQNSKISKVDRTWQNTIKHNKIYQNRMKSSRYMSRLSFPKKVWRHTTPFIRHSSRWIWQLDTEGQWNTSSRGCRMHPLSSSAKTKRDRPVRTIQASLECMHFINLTGLFPLYPSIHSKNFNNSFYFILLLVNSHVLQ